MSYVISAWIAQLAERHLGKMEVSGSTPDPGSKIIAKSFKLAVISSKKEKIYV